MSALTAFLLDPCAESAGAMRAILAKQEIEVVEWSTSGTGWVAAFQSKRPDFLVVDYMLPRRDGIFCLAKAREIAPSVKAFFTHRFTGLAANELELKALALGAQAVAQKPIVEGRFEELLARAVHIHKWENSQKQRTMTLTPTKK